MGTDFDIPVDCPACGAAFRVPRIDAGKDCACPLCGAAARAPGPDGAPRAAGTPSSPRVVRRDNAVSIESPVEPAPEPAPVRPLTSQTQLPSDAYAPCLVCVADGQRVVPGLVAPLIQEICGLTRQDALIQANRARGVLCETSADHARHLLPALARAGLECFAVDAAVVPEVPRVEPSRRISAAGDGLIVQTDHLGNARRIAWRSIVSVAATVLHSMKDVYRPSKSETYHVGGAYGGNVRTYSPGYHESRAQEDVQLFILASESGGPRPAVARWLFERLQIDYACLGREQTPSSTLNFQRFVGLLVDRLGEAFVPGATLDFLTGGQSKLPVFRFKPELDQYHLWCLCCRTALFGPIGRAS